MHLARKGHLILCRAARRTLASGWLCCSLFAALTQSQMVFASADDCGSLASVSGSYGPFDYRTATPKQIKIVEDNHFTEDVETLKKGITGPLGAELGYTLYAFPNHPRALVAMMNLQFKRRTSHPLGAKYSVPCYFDRAIRFRPDDAAVRTIFGVYLARLGKYNDAAKEFETAASLGDDSGNLHYNLGLAYFELGDYEKSIMHAKKAYDLGFNFPGLKEKLSKAGKWPPSQ